MIRRRNPRVRDGQKLRRRLLGLALIGLWIGLVLYPNPAPLVVSLGRLMNPPVDPMPVKSLAATLPDDPKAVEAFSQDYVRYECAWTLYGKFWYFPTVSEVLRDRAGDCQAEAILTASILSAKGLPYTLRYSFDHVWVDYPGKQVTDLEDSRTAFLSDEGEGWLAGLPRTIPLRTITEQRLAYHWSPMPAVRKIALLGGMCLVLLWAEGLGHYGGRLVRWRKGVASAPGESGYTRNTS